jgi:tetratricopeptide (TPR) repeat protein
MRTRPVFGVAALVSAAFLAAGPASGKDKGTAKPSEPFFHQFLIPGDPLDEKLLLQEKRVAESPNDAAMRNDYGNLLAERRFPKEARAEYKKALDLDKHFFLAAYNLGMMEEAIGNRSAAVSAYREAIHRRPGFPPAHFRLGRLHEIAGRNEDAIAEYAIAMRIDNSMRDPHRNPLAVDSRLLDQASLVNYSSDLARVAEAREDEYIDKERFRPVPVERPLDADELNALEDTGPQTIESHPSAPARQPAGLGGSAPPPSRADRRANSAAAAPRPGRRDMAPPPVANAVPTPVPAQAVPPPMPPPPTPEPEPEPQ